MLESYDIYNPFSGVTNNAIESLNAKLNRLLEENEKKVLMKLFYTYAICRERFDCTNGRVLLGNMSEWTLSNII